MLLLTERELKMDLNLIFAKQQLSIMRADATDMLTLRNRHLANADWLSSKIYAYRKSRGATLAEKRPVAHVPTIIAPKKPS